MKKNLNKLLSLLLVFALIAGFTPIMAAAEGDEGEPTEKTSAEQMRDLADTAKAEADKAAEAAADAATALENAENAVKEMTEEDGVVDTAEDALAEAGGKIDGAVTTDEDGIVTETIIDDALEDIADYANLATEDKTVEGDAATQAVIDSAVGTVNGLVTDVTNAVAEVKDVVDAASEVVEIAEGAATAAEAAIAAANKALENAQEAEKIYNELLQAAVTENNNEAYNALAEAENAMNEAWSEYSDAQTKADAELDAYHSVASEAAEIVKEALDKANEAQAKADTLYNEWMKAEAAMKAALNSTGDTDLIALEAMRAEARDAALSAMDSAKAAKRDAEKAFSKAAEAGAIVGELNDTAGKLVGKTNTVKGILADKLNTAATAAGYTIAPVEGVDPVDPTEGTTEYNVIDRQENKSNWELGTATPEFVLFKDGQGVLPKLVVWIPADTGLTAEQYRTLIIEKLTAAGKSTNMDWLTSWDIELSINEPIVGKNNTYNVEKGADGIWRATKRDNGGNLGGISNLIYVGGTYTPGTEGTPGKDPIPGREANFTVGTITSPVWTPVEITVPVLDLTDLNALVPLAPVDPTEKEDGNEEGGIEEEGGNNEGGGGWTPGGGGGNETTEEVNVLDEETPLGPAAPPAETVVAETEEVLELLDEDIPLGAATPMQMPKTGVTDTTSTWMIALCLSAMAAIALAGGLFRKTKED